MIKYIFKYSSELIEYLLKYSTVTGDVAREILCKERGLKYYNFAAFSWCMTDPGNFFQHERKETCVLEKHLQLNNRRRIETRAAPCNCRQYGDNRLQTNDITAFFVVLLFYVTDKACKVDNLLSNSVVE